MEATARMLRWVGCGLMLLFGLLVAVLAVGAALAENDGWWAVPLTLVWLALTVAGCVLAVRSPLAAARVLGGATAVVGLGWAAFAADPSPWHRGVALPVATVAVAVSVGVLGLRRPFAAGCLLLVLGLLPHLALLRAVRGLGDGNGHGSLLAASSGVGATPDVLAGLLLLAAAGLASLRRTPHAARGGSSARPPAGMVPAPRARHRSAPAPRR
jgi:hypothetical protein